MRAADPAAADTSLQTWLNSPSELAPSTANSTNCESRPPVMRPASTSCAPSHSTQMTLAKASAMATPVSSARARRRLARGVVSAFGGARETRVGRGLRVRGLHRAHGGEVLGGKGRRVGERILRPPRALPHRAARGHQRQDDDRDRDDDEQRQFRARPDHQPDARRTNMKRLRSAIDADEPKAALNCVVSAVRRETSSPIRALS